MSTLMERAAGLASRLLPKVAGGEIIYQRGESRVWINAAFGKSEFHVETADSVRIEHTDRDFIFAADLLILDGALATPQRGDRITVVSEEFGDNQVFEVLAPGGLQPYRLCNTEGHLIRVHTKKLS